LFGEDILTVLLSIRFAMLLLILMNVDDINRNTNSLLVSKAMSTCDVCKCSWPSDGREAAAAHEVLTYEEQQQPSLFTSACSSLSCFEIKGPMKAHRLLT